MTTDDSGDRTRPILFPAPHVCQITFENDLSRNRVCRKWRKDRSKRKACLLRLPCEVHRTLARKPAAGARLERRRGLADVVQAGHQTEQRAGKRLVAPEAACQDVARSRRNPFVPKAFRNAN